MLQIGERRAYANFCDMKISKYYTRRKESKTLYMCGKEHHIERYLKLTPENVEVFPPTFTVYSKDQTVWDAIES